MNNLNRYLFYDYVSILKNNKFVAFCELNSCDSNFVKLLKKDLKKNNFLLKNIKNSLIKSYFKNNFISNLIKGSTFIIYKNFVNKEKDLSIVKKLNDHNFILACLFYDKFYSFNKFKEFEGIKNQEKLYNKSLNSLFMTLLSQIYMPIKKTTSKIEV